MCEHAAARLACQSESVSTGRRFVADQLHLWGIVETDPACETLDDAVLVVSELLTNAVKHCATLVTVEVRAHERLIELTVTDDDPRPAAPRDPDIDDFGGRGLGIVSALSDDWGQSEWDGSTKTVWCQLRIPAGSALASSCGS
jgi:anti-sigma regulatory factor (Ser/Thr protein kinase)